MEWPYDHPRRGDMPYTSHALRFNEYTIRQPPYAQGLALEDGLLVRPGLERLGLQQEHRGGREGPSLHGHEATPGCARAAWAARRTSGAGSPCASPTTTSRPRATTATARTGRSPTPTSRPTTTRSTSTSASPAIPKGLAHLPDSLFQRPDPPQRRPRCGCASRWPSSGRVLTPYRAGVTTDGLKHNKYRSRCFGRGACSRRAGGCDIHAAFDSPTGLIYPAMDTGRLTLRTELDRARGHGRSRPRARRAASPSSTRQRGETLEAQAKVGGARRLHPRVGAPAAALEVRRSTRTASATRAATSATTSAST